MRRPRASRALTTTATASPPDPAGGTELLPGYFVEPETGAWLTLPPFPDDVLTIGHHVLAWCEKWLRHHLTGGPWRFTRGQVNFLLWWYAIHPDATPEHPKWLYRSGVKRGAKGTGKDPLLAAMCNAELCGPTRPVWRNGQWVGEPYRMALVQIAANSEAQASDVLRVANAMVDATMAAEFGYDKGILQTKLLNGSRLELLTNSEASSEGDPATAVFANETHHMTHTNGGQRLAGVGRRNVAKSPGGLARLLEGTNAHMPSEESVAEDSYEAWQAQVGGKTRRQDILYDSREAPPHLRLHVEEELMAGIAAAYADSPWTDLERIRDEAQDPRVPIADSIRFYFSSLPAAEDAWVEPRNFDRYADPDKIVEDGEAITMFLDCSKSDDATVLVGCRVSDGHVMALGCWQRPRGDRGKGWLAPREEVDAVGRAAFARYDVKWCGVDQSPARDDDDESALYWKELVDSWHRDFGKKLLVWATPGAKIGNSVSFDMRLSQPGGKERVRMFTEEAGLTAAAVDDDEAPERLTWDGDQQLRTHVHNARRRPNQWGVSLGKQSRSSSKKVDYAVAMVGARLGRRLVLNSGKYRSKRNRRAVFI
jgi:hypothetical protein